MKVTTSQEEGWIISVWEHKLGIWDFIATSGSKSIQREYLFVNTDVEAREEVIKKINAYEENTK